MSTIRRLNAKDAERMFECLKDKGNLKYLTLGYKDFSLLDCQNYIENSIKDNSSVHFAIVNEMDEWVGTISLKNIDNNLREAEYAIITDKSCQGKGYAKKATMEVIDYAFNNLGLNKIFLNVVEQNEKAIAFYKRIGFSYIGTSHQSVKLGQSFYNLEWYEYLRS